MDTLRSNNKMIQSKLILKEFWPIKYSVSIGIKKEMSWNTCSSCKKKKNDM